MKLVKKKKYIDVGVQIQGGDFRKDFCDIITTDTELSTLTGIINFNILNTVIDVVKLVYPKYESLSINLRSEIIITFVKLKHKFILRHTSNLV